MHIALTSDIHRAFNHMKDEKVERLAAQVAAESPDVVAILGDNCGTAHGARDTLVVWKIFRAANPGTPILACLGNHDYWQKVPSLRGHLEGLEQLRDAAKELGIHVFEFRGEWRPEKFPGVVFLGHGLWYAGAESEVRSNDSNFLPRGVQGDTWRHLQLTGLRSVEAQANLLDERDKVRIFCSHFPVWAEPEQNHKWLGDLNLGGLLQEHFGVKYFLCGHSHREAKGPLLFRCRSDYGKPAYLLVEIPHEG